MPPQEIADASASVRVRMAALVKEQLRAEREAIDAEQARVRAACAQQTGHVFGMQPAFLGASFRACVYCGAQPASAAAHVVLADGPECDV